MQHISTPFGARGLSAAMVAAQAKAAACLEGTAVADKWQLLRDLTDARASFAISDRAVAVLSALMSFLPGTEIAVPAVVFPSNRKLSDRAHGISESTLRRALAQLVDAGLIIRRDSPNGKRYPRGNDPADAYGFDLSPLAARAEEISDAAAAVREDRQRGHAARQAITVLLRDIRKVIAYAIECGVVVENWADRLTRLAEHRPRTTEQAEDIAFELGVLMAEITKAMELHGNSQNMHGTPGQTDRHKQDSNHNPSFEPERFETEDGKSEDASPEPGSPGKAWRGASDEQRFDLSTIVAACPSLKEWSQMTIRDWDDLFRAAEQIRPALGISPSAWADAVDAMGRSGAAVTLATVLERAEVIKTPGGYLRALVAKARAGQFSPSPILVALLKARSLKAVKPLPS